MADEDFLRELVKSPSEALAVEVKEWFDPSTPDGEAKIARCLLAMRNHGGGFLVIGFENLSLKPAAGRPNDPRGTFHADVVQAIVSRYASEAFEVTVHFPERDGLEFPVIEVPSGVRTLVASKSDLFDTAKKRLVQQGAVYFRSLDSNGVVSTTNAGWRDWSRIIETCFDNREADIGRFVRRHLSGEGIDTLKMLVDSLGGESTTKASALTLQDRLKGLLDAGLAPYRTVARDRNSKATQHGWWETGALVMDCPPSETANLHFLNALLSSNPNLTGWPAWVDSRNFAPEKRPYLADDETWETFIDNTGDVPGDIDFWRLSTRGEFYLYRSYQDDTLGTKGSPRPNTTLDFGLPLFRVTEILAVGLALGRALGAPLTGSVVFGFRWNALLGRILSGWAQPDRVFIPGRRAYRDTAFSTVNVPQDTPLSAIHTFVRAATKPLFEAFDGFELAPNIVEEFSTKILSRSW